MSKFIDDADDMVWQQVTLASADEVELLRAIDDELEANGADLTASVQPANADEVELLELARILYRRDKPEALRLALMAADGVGTRREILRAYRAAVARLPVIH